MRARHERREPGVRLADRVAARLAGLRRPATAIAAEGNLIGAGSPRRGLQLATGRFLFAGTLIEAPGVLPWDLPVPDAGFAAALHGFAWLDDLAALGDRRAEERARLWTQGWIRRFGRGGGPGWTPELAGRRLLAWIQHAHFLADAAPEAERRALLAAATRAAAYLARRAGAAPPGLPRIAALAGLVHAAAALDGLGDLVDPASRALAREAAARIGPDGAIASRAPEELLEVFALLVSAAAALGEARERVPREHEAAIARAAPVLRALRHADGGLARFHGGGRGAEGRLDHALAASGLRRSPPPAVAMGYARLAHGRATLLADAAPPPLADHSGEGHASTLAFELTVGRRPIVVSCGAGATFGARWRRAGRSTAAHSTLELEGLSSSRTGLGGLVAGRRPGRLVEAPATVTAAFEGEPPGLVLSHDGYAASHGVLHRRRLALAPTGRALDGEDRLEPAGTAGRTRLVELLRRSPTGTLAFAIRFHLHPDVEAEAEPDGTSARLLLRSGEIWRLAVEARGAHLAVEPSVYLETGRLQPRAAQQVVLSGEVVGYATRVGWSLAVAAESPPGLRDTAMDDALALD